jgi:hypothetical protein
MKLLVAAPIIAAVFGSNISIAVAGDLYPGWTPSNCTPPLAAITMGSQGLVSVKTGPDVVIETRPGSYTMVFRRPGYDGSATVEIERVEDGSRTSIRLTEGGMRSKTGDRTIYVYLPGGTVCPHGAPPPSM